MCEASTPAITPIILCGGSGTRLWPLSRKSYPKQFAQIMEDESLLQSCVRRLSGTSEVLVADMGRQDVGQVVKEQRAKGVAQADTFSRDHRPWGYFETLAISERFQVKRIVVKPGAASSLQSHVHRTEHWVVVSGTARVTIDAEVRLLTENESVYIPLGAVHRLENPGKVPMTLIEVQTGIYLGEDDITRYKDVYARGTDEV